MLDIPDFLFHSFNWVVYGAPKYVASAILSTRGILMKKQIKCVLFWRVHSHVWGQTQQNQLEKQKGFPDKEQW